MNKPVTKITPQRWIKDNLFNSKFNSVLTIVSLVTLIWVAKSFTQWAFVNSVWIGNAAECRAADGACWAFIIEKFRFIFFGTYLSEEQWRPAVAMILFFALVLFSKNRKHWQSYLAGVWAVGLLAIFVLMRGGVFGLPLVESPNWGGLPLTLMLATGGIVCSYPFAILLALGRRSQMPIVKSVCITFIEVVRGVPLISLLFMSSVMLPLFFPEGFSVNKILRAQIAIIIFVSAYLAEVIRGGLQAIPNGQYEACDSLGLNTFHKMRLVILPQALKIVIPPTVNIFISVLKDTSLVVIISMFDLLGAGKATLIDPDWLGFSRELYVFLALIYFVLCFSLAKYSLNLEKSLSQSEKR